MPSPPAFTTPTALPLHSCPTHAVSPRRSPPHRHAKRQFRAAVATPPAPLLPSNHDPMSTLAPAIVGEAELEAALSQKRRSSDTLIVVMFYARWCRVCKTIAGKLPRIAPDFPHVKWLRVDFAELENKPLVSDLGIKLLPTFRFYRPGMSVADKPLEQFTSGPFGTKLLVERLEMYEPEWSK